MIDPETRLVLDREFALCICTYKRAELLKLLLLDVLSQTVKPGSVVIVDGDSASGDVQSMLQTVRFPPEMSVHYVPSNHGNQTYQRYLGFQISRNGGIKRLLYLDDDLRIEQRTSIQNMIAPLAWLDRNIVAVTGTLDMGIPKPTDGSLSIAELRQGIPDKSKILARLGTSRRYQSGDVTPAGNRVIVENRGNDYETVRWLRGGAIAFRVENLSERVLSDDIFAMNHLKYGLCEDLIISRRLISAGEILLAFNAVFRHPSEDPPKAYSSNAYRLGFATAYSRKWFNDNYRGSEHPRVTDRLTLIKNYVGVIFLNAWRALISHNKQRASFTYGFLRGAVYAFIRKPTAKSLTPEINWWADAEQAISQVVIVQ